MCPRCCIRLIFLLIVFNLTFISGKGSHAGEQKFAQRGKSTTHLVLLCHLCSFRTRLVFLVTSFLLFEPSFPLLIYLQFEELCSFFPTNALPVSRYLNHQKPEYVASSQASACKSEADNGDSVTTFLLGYFLTSRIEVCAIFTYVRKKNSMLSLVLGFSIF